MPSKKKRSTRAIRVNNYSAIFLETQGMKHWELYNKEGKIFAFTPTKEDAISKIRHALKQHQ
jgi:hypothetical protein